MTTTNNRRTGRRVTAPPPPPVHAVSVQDRVAWCVCGWSTPALRADRAGQPADQRAIAAGAEHLRGRR
jgi:hypothetical protein